MPRRWAPQTALRDRGQLVDLVAGADLPPDTLLQEGMLERPARARPGQREIAIMVDAETGVAGKIGPGSVVDIIATFAGGHDPASSPSRRRRARRARSSTSARPRSKGGRNVQEAEQQTRSRSCRSRSR